MQSFLGGLYATLAAAQWACGRVLMDVEVAFDSQTVSRNSGLWDGGDSSQTVVFAGEQKKDTYGPS